MSKIYIMITPPEAFKTKCSILRINIACDNMLITIEEFLDKLRNSSYIKKICIAVFHDVHNRILYEYCSYLFPRNEIFNVTVEKLILPTDKIKYTSKFPNAISMHHQHCIKNIFKIAYTYRNPICSQKIKLNNRFEYDIDNRCNMLKPIQTFDNNTDLQQLKHLLSYDVYDALSFRLDNFDICELEEFVEIIQNSIINTLLLTIENYCGGDIVMDKLLQNDKIIILSISSYDDEYYYNMELLKNNYSIKSLIYNYREHITKEMQDRNCYNRFAKTKGILN